jgi:uncharacterized protein
VKQNHNPAIWLRASGLLACLLLGLAACRGGNPASNPLATSTVIAASAGTVGAAVVVVPTATPEASPLPAEPAATATHVPSNTPTATPTTTPSPTPTLHPMTIAAMRQLAYPGSDVVIEQVLEPGVNYRHYRASYQSEGLKIYALLTVPNGEPPENGWPVIVFNHGYIPPAQYRTAERYVAYVDNLARNGYIVFRSDYRGHDQSEGVARGAYGAPDYTIDVLNAVASMKRYPEADPERIGMWGHSMGGYITLRSMVVSPDIKAGVIWAGVVASYPDLLDRWRGTFQTPTPDPLATPGGPRSWRAAWVQEFGLPEQNPEFWEAVSSNSYLADLSGPVQLHHGTADTSVPHAFSVTLAEQIAAAGGSVAFYSYEGDNHNLSGFFVQAMTRTVEFFNQHLKP